MFVASSVFMLHMSHGQLEAIVIFMRQKRLYRKFATFSTHVQNCTEVAWKISFEKQLML